MVVFYSKWPKKESKFVFFEVETLYFDWGYDKSGHCYPLYHCNVFMKIWFVGKQYTIISKEYSQGRHYLSVIENLKFWPIILWIPKNPKWLSKLNKLKRKSLEYPTGPIMSQKSMYLLPFLRHRSFRLYCHFSF